MFKAGDHAWLSGEEVVIDEVLDDTIAVRFVGHDCVFEVTPDKLQHI